MSKRMFGGKRNNKSKGRNTKYKGRNTKYKGRNTKYKRIKGKGGPGSTSLERAVMRSSYMAGMCSKCTALANFPRHYGAPPPHQQLRDEVCEACRVTPWE